MNVALFIKYTTLICSDHLKPIAAEERRIEEEEKKVREEQERIAKQLAEGSLIIHVSNIPRVHFAHACSIVYREWTQ